jgi:predicted amidohydrolase YtcJ
LARNRLFYNCRIYTQAGVNTDTQVVADSMAISRGTIVAVGKRLECDDEFKKYQKIDLKKKVLLPGFTDSHTHFAFSATTYDNINLDGLDSLDAVLDAIKKHSRKLKRNEWVVGFGFAPDQWSEYIIPDRYMLDKVTGGRPAAMWSKDTHAIWANSKALEIGGVNRHTRDPKGGKIERLDNNIPSGILKEVPAYFLVFKKIKQPDRNKALKMYKRTLKMAYSVGVTGVHSMDGPEALDLFVALSEKGQLGLRINYYPPCANISDLKKAGIKFGYGDDYLKISGIKIFTDGALGNQTAYCFNKYIGSKNNYGIEVTAPKELSKYIKQAAALNLPCAVHAIGDKAISNTLDCFEKAPKLLDPARHRIEHVQMIRRKDIARLKKLGVIASMQPSHCPADIGIIEKYWGNRGRNCYLFNTFWQQGVPLAFGSDLPIEPLDPIAGIHAAVNRKRPSSRKVFYPQERLTVAQAVYGFTAGAAYAVGQEYERGYLLPGYKADFIILSDDIYKIAKSKINSIRVDETYFDGWSVFKRK